MGEEPLQLNLSNNKGTLFGRPIVRTFQHPSSHEIEFENDRGERHRLTEEQFYQLRIEHQ